MTSDPGEASPYEYAAKIRAGASGYNAAKLVQEYADSVAEPLRREVEELKSKLATIKDRVRWDEDFDADAIVELIDLSIGKFSQSQEWAAKAIFGEIESDLTKCRERCAELERRWEMAESSHTRRQLMDGNIKQSAKLVEVTAERDALQTALDSKTCEAMELRKALTKLTTILEGIAAENEPPGLSEDAAEAMIDRDEYGVFQAQALLRRTDYSRWLPVLRTDYEALKAKTTQP